MADQNNHKGQSGKSVLVIGGGISGITAAVEAAETGCMVYLVERDPYLGGQVARMNEYFPKLCPPYCGLEINFRRIRNSSRIEVITSARVEKISGRAGNFRVRLHCDPEYVSAACTACGECAAVCPVESSDPFNYGLSARKAIDLPHELSYPYRYRLDDSACLKESCRKCLPACRYDAIDLGAKSSTRELDVGTVLYCTGWSPYDPSNLTEYSWGKSPDILTNVMMERLGAPNGPSGGKILRQSTGKPASRVAFIQCAGSRDENHLPYCSSVCCSASLKQALYFVEQDPRNRADIYYIDLRVAGRNEDFLRKVENHGRIRLIKGKASGLSLETGQSTGKTREPDPETTEPVPNKMDTETAEPDPAKVRPVVEAEDILSGRKIRNAYDLVILATGMVPNLPVPAGTEPDPARTVLDPDGFINRDALEEGFAAGGCCADPKDVAASVREATGLVIHALNRRDG